MRNRPAVFIYLPIVRMKVHETVKVEKRPTFLTFSPKRDRDIPRILQHHDVLFIARDETYTASKTTNGEIEMDVLQ